MIKNTGLLDYLKSVGIKFYPMIYGSDYYKDIHEDMDNSKNKIAIMGIGNDGHTASLPASPKLQRGEPAGSQISNLKSQKYVEEINNFPIDPRERITLTFNALAQMDLLIILAFGSAKQNVLRKMFEEGLVEEIPARFYLREDIAKKTILITDQKI